VFFSPSFAKFLVFERNSQISQKKFYFGKGILLYLEFGHTFFGQFSTVLTAFCKLFTNSRQTLFGFTTLNERLNLFFKKHKTNEE